MLVVRHSEWEAFPCGVKSAFQWVTQAPFGIARCLKESRLHARELAYWPGLRRELEGHDGQIVSFEAWDSQEAVGGMAVAWNRRAREDTAALLCIVDKVVRMRCEGRSPIADGMLANISPQLPGIVNVATEHFNTCSDQAARPRVLGRGVKRVHDTPLPMRGTVKDHVTQIASQQTGLSHRLYHCPLPNAEYFLFDEYNTKKAKDEDAARNPDRNDGECVSYGEAPEDLSKEWPEGELTDNERAPLKALTEEALLAGMYVYPPMLVIEDKEQAIEGWQ